VAGEADGLIFRFGPRLFGFIAAAARCSSIRFFTSECGTLRTCFIVLVKRSHASGPSTISEAGIVILVRGLIALQSYRTCHMISV